MFASIAWARRMRPVQFPKRRPKLAFRLARHFAEDLAGGAPPDLHYPATKRFGLSTDRAPLFGRRQPRDVPKWTSGISKPSVEKAGIRKPWLPHSSKKLQTGAQ